MSGATITAVNPPELIRIGRVGRAHGLAGAVRVTLDNPASEAFASLARVFLESTTGPRPYVLLEARRLGHNAVRLVLEGVNSCAAAEALRGAVILIATADLPLPQPDEFYRFQAIGCAVVTLDGQYLGAVKEIFGTGANDVFVVYDGSREVLIPVIGDVVKTLDFTSRRITIDALPGLLD